MFVGNSLAPEYAEERRTSETILWNADTTEALSLGHSHNRGLDFGALGMRGLPWWIGGSDVFECEYRLRVVLREMPRLRAVFMTLDPLMLNCDDEITPRGRERRRLYCAVTPTAASYRPIGGDFRSLVAGKLSPLVRSDHWAGVIAPYVPWVDLWSPVVVGDPRDRWGEHPPQGPAEMRAHAVYRADEHIRTTSAMAEMDPTIPKRASDAVVRMERAARKRGVRLILHSPPCTVFYTDRLDEQAPDLMRRGLDCLDRLGEDHGIRWYDFSRDPEFAFRWDWFYDSHHLNRAGARAFCAKLREAAGL